MSEEEVITFEYAGESWKIPKHVLAQALKVYTDDFEVSQSTITVRTKVGSITVGCAVSAIKAAEESDEYGLSACQNKSCTKAKRTGHGCGSGFSGTCEKCERTLCDKCTICEWCSIDSE